MPYEFQAQPQKQLNTGEAALEKAKELMDAYEEGIHRRPLIRRTTQLMLQEAQLQIQVARSFGYDTYHERIRCENLEKQGEIVKTNFLRKLNNTKVVEKTSIEADHRGT